MSRGLEIAVRELAMLKTPEEVIELREAVQRNKAEATELMRRFDEALVDWINENGSFEVGTLRYYVGDKKTWKKTLGHEETIERALDYVNGDVEMFGKLLSSSQSAWKHGEIRELEHRLGIPEEESLYTCQTVPEVRTGKAKKIVKTIPTGAS